MNGAGDGSLKEEEYFSETPDQAATRIIEEAAPFAAQSIATMATDDTVAASVRLRAAQYVIDRRLGPVGQAGGKVDELEMFLEELQRSANEGH